MSYKKLTLLLSLVFIIACNEKSDNYLYFNNVSISDDTLTKYINEYYNLKIDKKKFIFQLFFISESNKKTEIIITCTNSKYQLWNNVPIGYTDVDNDHILLYNGLTRFCKVKFNKNISNLFANKTPRNDIKFPSCEKVMSGIHYDKPSWLLTFYHESKKWEKQLVNDSMVYVFPKNKQNNTFFPTIEKMNKNKREQIFMY